MHVHVHQQHTNPLHGQPLHARITKPFGTVSAQSSTPVPTVTSSTSLGTTTLAATPTTTPTSSTAPTAPSLTPPTTTTPLVAPSSTPAHLHRLLMYKKIHINTPPIWKTQHVRDREKRESWHSFLPHVVDRQQQRNPKQESGDHLLHTIPATAAHRRQHTYPEHMRRGRKRIHVAEKHRENLFTPPSFLFPAIVTAGGDLRRWKVPIRIEDEISNRLANGDTVSSLAVKALFHVLSRVYGAFSASPSTTPDNIEIKDEIRVELEVLETQKQEITKMYNEILECIHGMKEDLNLVQLGSHLRIEESLRTQELDINPKGKNQIGSSSVNMVEGEGS
ncbi:hypothetical protein LXL04_019661 [Taraxacum kok-saghyz]